MFIELTTLTDGTLTNYITTSVTQGSTYAFKISALNIYGEGVESDAIAITPAAPPDPPTDFTLISADTSHISFSWTPGYTGGKAISNYLIKWDQGSGSSDLSTFVSSSPSSTGGLVSVSISVGI